MTADIVIHALLSLRVPPGASEADIHARIAARLEAAGIRCVHEAKIAPRCRIDFLAGDVGIEVKRGRPSRRILLKQMSRYAVSESVAALILVAERGASLPAKVGGKPCYCISLSRLWGVALPA